ncbi:hypothetical protein IAD21_04876 [Abditibacteriota bacterium]|nr:hypothetical protein IAD21_04876 [Abditibacteriota bacterium]
MSFGIGTLWLLAPVPSEPLQTNMGVLVAVAALGALMPDLDASESKIKHLKLPNTQFKPFMLPALVVGKTDQHRGLMHSLAGLGMMAFFMLPFTFSLGWDVSVAFLFGYASHLVADSATRTGIRLLYPNTRRFYLLPPRWRFTTGSFVEETLFVPLALCCFVLLLRSLFGI